MLPHPFPKSVQEIRGAMRDENREGSSRPSEKQTLMQVFIAVTKIKCEYLSEGTTHTNTSYLKSVCEPFPEWRRTTYHKHKHFALHSSVLNCKQLAIQQHYLYREHSLYLLAPSTHCYHFTEFFLMWDNKTP